MRSFGYRGHWPAMTAVAAIATAVAFGVAAAGCGDAPAGNGAAVLVRWRLMDGVTGTQVSRCVGKGPNDGSYCCGNVGGTGNAAFDVTIERLRLRAEPVCGDGRVLYGHQPDCPSCCFACEPNEHTTRFELPPNTYKLTLEAYSCGRRVGSSPAPLVRKLGPGDLVNMQVQGILLFPSDAVDDTSAPRCPRGPQPPAVCPGDGPPGDAGEPPDGGAPDGAPGGDGSPAPGGDAGVPSDDALCGP